MQPTLFEYSAGGVALKDDTVLLIRVHDMKARTVWTFPKGRLNAGETSPDAALREVQEETGWRCRIERELTKSEYWFRRDGQRIKKTVRWFHMTPVELAGSPDHEVDEVAWVQTADALTRLTYDSDRALLLQAVSAPTGEARSKP
jgi:ADP-ribose pyrophosphatase YjhB (NUDIX family)